MSLPILHAIGALTAALCYLVLTLYVVIAWARKLTSRWMLIASLATLMLLATRFVTGLSPATLVIESVATVSWLVFLAETLGVWHDTDGASGTRTALTVSVIGVAMGLLSILTFAVAQVFEAPPALSPVAIRAVLELLLAVAGLVLLEQLYRNTRSEQRWRSRHLVTGLGGLFTYDLVLQAVALLYPQKLTAFYAVQPMVFAVTAPFLAIAIRRTVDAPLAMHLSREFVFAPACLSGRGFSCWQQVCSAISYSFLEATGRTLCWPFSSFWSSWALR